MIYQEPTIYNAPSIYKAGGSGGGGGGDTPLPPEYQKLEYIRTKISSNTPEMAGGNIKLDYTDSIEGKFFFNEAIVGTNWIFFFYTWDMQQRMFKIEGTNQRSKLAWGSSGATEQNTNFVQGDFKFSFSVADGLKINGVTYPSNVGSNDGIKTLGRLAHFALQQDCSMYGYVIKDISNNVKYNLVPALRILDSKTGLYDTVNNSFITPVSGWDIPGPTV